MTREFSDRLSDCPRTVIASSLRDTPTADTGAVVSTPVQGPRPSPLPSPSAPAHPPGFPERSPAARDLSASFTAERRARRSPKPTARPQSEGSGAGPGIRASSLLLLGLGERQNNNGFAADGPQQDFRGDARRVGTKGKTSRMRRAAPRSRLPWAGGCLGREWRYHSSGRVSRAAFALVSNFLLFPSCPKQVN